MKTVLITGASSEIGLSIARLLENKYNLIIIKHEKDIDVKEFRKVPKIFRSDFNDESEIRKLLNELKEIKIDMLINVAAYDQNESIENIKIEELIKTIKINCFSPFLLIQKLFDKESDGIVINVASTDGIDTYNEYNLPYATSKAALIHMTKQLSVIYKNLHIYAICPNYINTQSVRNMEQEFLNKELKRIEQNKLIEVSDVSNKIEEIINTLPENIIIRME